jgi:hypothetical protein
MPRRHRREEPEDEFLVDLDRLKGGFRRTEHKRGQAYTVQPISAASARKEYRCPGCGLEVAIGVAHVVVWAEDSLFGPEAAVADRRHWHNHCWKIF